MCNEISYNVEISYHRYRFYVDVFPLLVFLLVLLLWALRSCTSKLY